MVVLGGWVFFMSEVPRTSEGEESGDGEEGSDLRQRRVPEDGRPVEELVPAPVQPCLQRPLSFPPFTFTFR